MQRFRVADLVITKDNLPALVREVRDNEILIAKFTEKITITVSKHSIRHITKEEREKLTYIPNTKIMTMKQDRLITYLNKQEH